MDGSDNVTGTEFLVRAYIQHYSIAGIYLCCQLVTAQGRPGAARFGVQEIKQYRCKGTDQNIMICNKLYKACKHGNYIQQTETGTLYTAKKFTTAQYRSAALTVLQVTS